MHTVKKRATGGLHLWWRRHLLSPSDKGDIDAVPLILCFVVKAELGIRSDDSNLARVAQHLGSVVLPVTQDGHTQLCSMPLLWVGFLLVHMDMRLISAQHMMCSSATESESLSLCLCTAHGLSRFHAGLAVVHSTVHRTSSQMTRQLGVSITLCIAVRSVSM